MAAMPPLMDLWKQMSRLPLGKTLFSRAVCLRAPYFASIQPLITDLSKTHCEVRIRKRRAVQNHIGTVHAIAMCNMAEVAAGVLAEVAVPAATHRWIPKGMTVEYLKKAGTDLKAVARPTVPMPLEEPGDYPIEVLVEDTEGTLVFRALINMWVSKKKHGGA